MRLLHVVPTYIPATRYGGPIYSVHGLCTALVQAGHEVHVFTTNVDGSGNSDVPLSGPVDRDGVQVHYFPSSTLRRLYWSPSMRQALRTDIERFDLVHLHSVFLWPTSMAARVAAAAGVPYVVSPRGMLVPDLIAARSRRVKTAWLALIESRTLADAAVVHFTSDNEKSAAQRLALPLPSPVVVPNGTELPDPQHLSAAPSSIAALTREPYALFLGRIVPKKGLGLLSDAVAGTPMRVLAFGPDDDGYGPKIAAQIAAARSPVQLHAAVDGVAKTALLARARVLVLPSSQESFGNVVVEAMAAGCPVVTTSGVGASPIVRDAGAGVVCANQSDALREGLARLWDDEALRIRMGAAGRAYVETHLTWPRVAEQMLALYDTAMRVPRAGRRAQAPAASIDVH
jgi:glycosyltransferase involved in cell wall biosynthesis